MNDIDTARIRDAAATIQTLAIGYGVTIPKAHATNAAVAAEARRVASELAPVPLSLPTTVAKVGPAAKKIATDRLLAAEARKAAEEIAERADLEAMRVLFNLRGTVLQAIADAFATDVATFGELLDSAPLEVNGNHTDEEVAAHRDLLRVSERLTSAAGSRISLAAIDGEDLRDTENAWFVLEPRPDVMLSEVRDAVAAGVPNDLAGWVRAHHIGAAIAGPDQAAQRATRFGQAVWHAGHATPDGGLAERSYAEALALVPGGQ